MREIAIGSTQNIVEEGDAWGRSLARENIVTSERRAEEALVHIQLKRLHLQVLESPSLPIELSVSPATQGGQQSDASATPSPVACSRPTHRSWRAAAPTAQLYDLLLYTAWVLTTRPVTRDTA